MPPCINNPYYELQNGPCLRVCLRFALFLNKILGVMNEIWREDLFSNMVLFTMLNDVDLTVKVTLRPKVKL